MPNAGKTIEQIANNKIEQIARKTFDLSKTIELKAIKTIKVGTEKYFITCIENLRAEYLESKSLTNLFGRNTANQVSISATDQLTDTNRTRM